MLDPTTSEDMRTAILNLQLSPDRENVSYAYDSSDDDHRSSDEEREDWEAAVSSDDEEHGDSDS
eukprot:scaffold663115_cov64-Prasinocladus_malaysianus.AAC.1